jgi:acyl dehydratase
MDNVVLGPWIHVGSKVQHVSVANVGEALSARARVAANYEKKGHRFVDLDTLVIANHERAVAHILHTAIYRLRAPD